MNRIRRLPLRVPTAPLLKEQSLKQHEDALKMFALLQDRLLSNMPPINGYSIAAEAIGLTADHAVHIGQVNSRIDVAAFNAGYPMIATHMVRKPNGRIHPKAFGGVWEKYKEECISSAETHRWTSKQLDEVRVALDALPERSFLLLWEEIRDRDFTDAGFIRRQLHCKVIS
jgi:hypothetical protein